MKVSKVTGQQIQHLKDHFGLQVGDIDFGRNQADVFKLRQNGSGKTLMLRRATVCKMLGIDADSPAVAQNGKWCILKF